MATKKLDVYSDIELPLDIAIWARGHKYNVTAVGLAKCLRLRDQLRAVVRAAEHDLDIAEAELKKQIEIARGKMNESTGA